MTSRGTPEEVRQALEDEAIDFAEDDVAAELEGAILALRLPDDEEPWFAAFETSPDGASSVQLQRGLAGLARLSPPVASGPGRWLRLHVGVSDGGDEYVPRFTARDGTEAVRELTEVEQAFIAVALAAVNDAVTEGLLPPESPPISDERPVLVVTDDGSHLTHSLAWERFGDAPDLEESRRRIAQIADVLDGRAEAAPGDEDPWLLAEGDLQDKIAERLAVERVPDAEAWRSFFGVRQDDLDETAADAAGEAFRTWLALRPNRSGDRASPADRLLRRGELRPLHVRVLASMRETRLAIVRIEVADTKGAVTCTDDETGARSQATLVLGAQAVEAGDRVVARLLSPSDVVLLQPASPPLRAEEVADARELLARFGGDLTAASMNAKPHLVGRLWWWIYTPAGDEGEEPLEDE